LADLNDQVQTQVEAERLEQVQRAFTAYTIERELGRGGMATVFLAHDKKHNRRVAIKILHAELAAALGTERFLQEIRVTANLQHPHILGLIDSGVIGDVAGELKGRPYYVMPYVDGESLSDRLDKERQLPVADAVRITTEVANALDYAHRHGVIHRDIKPANILLHDGSAIVADFGIALAVTQAGGGRLTQTGVSLGTPMYMSPEQAFGERTLTLRTDIYSLGAVTYEMLSGEPPFTGPTAHAILLRVMTEEPRPLTTVRRNVPANVQAAVSQALEKIPADRFDSAHEFAEALNNPSFTRSRQSAPSAPHPSSDRQRLMMYGGGLIAALLLATALWAWRRPALAQHVLRYTQVFDSAEAIVAGGSYATRLAISPDGSTLAYIGGPRSQLIVQPRDQLRSTAVPGTEGMSTPFFSPDGQRVAAMVEGTIRITTLNGGSPIAVTDSLLGVAGGSWGSDGFIYADADGGGNSLLRVEPKAGAAAKWFTSLDAASGEVDHFWPDVLPNGKGVLFTIGFIGKNAANRRIYSVAVAAIPSGKHRILVNDAIYARYAPPGYLLYVTTSRTLMAVPFDQGSMKITGEPTVVVEGMRLGSLGSADLAVSAGTLIYGTGSGQGKEDLVWVTREGKSQLVDSTWSGFFRSPVLSPDGTHVATEFTGADTTNVWIKRLDQGPTVRLTFEGTQNLSPAWTPDGRSITFTSNKNGAYDIWTRRADGSAPATLQFRGMAGAGSARWSPDGKWLVLATERSARGDILGIRVGIDTVPVKLVATNFSEGPPSISPDGRWLAYTSDESGRYEIYVVPFPNTRDAKWVVSSRGGGEPIWSHSGKELFYRDGDENLVAVTVRTTPTFSTGAATVLFSAAGFRSAENQAQYAISPDDRRFLMVRQSAATTASEKLIVVENWFEDLKAKSRKGQGN
jgi:serine/threonine protein kinase